MSEWRALSAPKPVTVITRTLTPGDVSPVAEAFAMRSRAANTMRGYAADWRAWQTWATEHGRATMPADPRALEDWLCDAAADHTPGTLTRRLAAIRLAHETLGYPSPTGDPHLRRVLEGIRRTIGRPTRRKTALLLDDLRACVATLDLDTLEGLRDRAMLTLGWAAALRRSELVAVCVEDIDLTDDGIRLMIRRSKTDQGGEGQIIGVPHAKAENDAICPVCAIADWMAAANITRGPVFRRLIGGNGVGDVAIRDKGVAEMVQKVTRMAGIDGDFSGHSLRAGMVTQAAREGVDSLVIARQTRHRRVDTLAAYIREGDLFRRNPATEAGL